MPLTLTNRKIDMDTLYYLTNYPEPIKNQVLTLIRNNTLANLLLTKYPTVHNITNNKALYNYTIDLKNAFIRKSGPLSKVVYDDKLDIRHQALGLHTFATRVQGNNLKAKNEIRIGSVFIKTPIEFLKMIVVHELAHIKEKQHNKAFYQLCQHMEPNYYQFEFDLRLYLTYIELSGELYAT